MTTTIFGGLFTHPNSMYDLSWVARAIVRWSDWSRRAGMEYRFTARSLSDWSKFAAFPYAWEFGANIKYAAIEEFLKDESLGNRFLWIDPDIYPTEAALGFDWESLPLNCFLTRVLPPTWMGFPGPMHIGNQHAYCKLIWTNRQHCESSIVFDAGLMSMSRETAQAFWDWLNKDASIHTEEWWENHAAKQAECVVKLLDLEQSHAAPWMFGTDEMYFEDWINSTEVSYSNFPDGLHEHYNPDVPSNALLVHYNSTHKKAFPL